MSQERPSSRAPKLTLNAPVSWRAFSSAHQSSTPYCTFFTAGGFQVPFKIEGEVGFGQYMRNIGMNSPVGAGSQLFSLSLPGDSFWKYSVSEPSALYLGLSRGLTVKRLSGLGTNHQPPSTMYMVIDQKPLTGGVSPLAKVKVYLF